MTLHEPLNTSCGVSGYLKNSPEAHLKSPAHAKACMLGIEKIRKEQYNCPFREDIRSAEPGNDIRFNVFRLEYQIAYGKVEMLKCRKLSYGILKTCVIK